MSTTPETTFVATIRDSHPGKFIPDFDPKDGGVSAEVLILLEAPGPLATQFVSRDNPDPTARNLKVALELANIPREKTCLWNIIPFYIGLEDRARIRAANQRDIMVGTPYVLRLIDKMPQLRSVALLGRKAQRAEPHLSTKSPDLIILKSWHPSGRSLNSFPNRRSELTEAFVKAANALV